MKASFLPYGSYVYHRRIKYDHGHQNYDCPFAWDDLGTEVFEKHSHGDSLVDEPANEFPGFDVPGLRTCVYCGSELHHAEEFLDGRQEWSRGDSVTCKRCSWWLYAYTKNKFYPWASIQNEIFEGAIYSFDTENTDQPITVLREAIGRNRRDLRYISPGDLELLVGSVLRDFFQCKVRHIGGPGDGGIDLLLAEAETPIAVQVKRREKSKPSESVKVVRELLGSMVVKEIPKGIVVSTAAEFSKPAQAEATSGGIARAGMNLDLYNYDRIREVLQLTTRPEKPWLSCLPENKLGEANWSSWPPGAQDKEA